jgi:hypothetical protein
VRGTTAYADLINLAGTSITTGGTGAGAVSVNLAMKDLTEWNSAGPAWDQAPNWTTGVPTATKAAVVNTSGQIATVTAPMGLQQAETLIIDNGGHVHVDGGSLQVMGNAWVEPTGSLTVNSTLKVGSIALLPGPSGLMGYWALNESSGTVAADSSGRSHPGTVNGTAPWQPLGGKFGGAMSFDGATDIRIPYSADFNLATYTVSAWVNIAADQANGGILGTRFGGDNSFDLKVQAAMIHGDVGSGSGWINTAVDIPAPQGDIPLNSWQMVTYVIDDTAKQFQLYLNGALVTPPSPISYTGTPQLMRSGLEMRLGNSSGTEYLANGLLDDVAIWNRALSAADILALYQTGPNSVPLPLVPTFVGGTLTTAGTTIFGPDANLEIPRINVVGGTTTGLGTPGTPHATLAAGTTLKLAGGTLAGTFGATNTSTIPGSYAFEIESGVSNANLVAPTASLRKSTAGAATLAGTQMHFANLNIEEGSTLITHGAKLTANSMNVSGGSVRMERGAEVSRIDVGSSGSMTFTRDIKVTGSLNGTGTLIADGNMTLDLSSAGASFGGELRVTNTNPATSGNLLVNLPAGTPLSAGLVGYWSFDASDISGTTAFDRSGYGNNGILQRGPVQVPGIAGGAVRLDGDNDFVEIPHSASLNVNNAFSVGVWAQVTEAGAWFRTLVAKYGLSSVTESWGLGWMNAGRLGFYVRDSGGNRTWVESPVANLGLDGGWHQFLGVRGDGKVQFYMDGELVTETADISGNITNTRPVTAARHSDDNTTNHVQGVFDDMAIWNRALSPTEVQSLYERGLSGVGLGPVVLGHLRLDPSTQITLGGAGVATFATVGATGGPTVAGDLTLKPTTGGSAANVKGGVQSLTLNATVDAPKFEITGIGTVTLTDRLNIASGGTLNVPKGVTLASQGNVTMDISSATAINKGLLNVASGTLTLTLADASTRPAGSLISGTALRFDGTDINGDGTIDSLANGTAIGTWVNKGTLAGVNATQGTAARQPAVTNAAMNGKAVVSFARGAPSGATGTEDYLEINNAALTNVLNNPHTIFVVSRTNNGGADDGAAFNNYQAIVCSPGNHNDIRFNGGFTSGSTSVTTEQWYGANAGAIASSGPYTQGTVAVLDEVLTGNSTAGPSSIQLFINGAAQPLATNADRINNSNPSILRIGSALTAWANYSWFLTGDVAEVLVYPSALSATDRQSVENFLMNKWLGNYTALGDLNLAAGAQLILNSKSGGPGTAGFTSIVSGNAAQISGNVAVGSRLNVAETLTIGSSLTLSDGMVYEWDIVKGPRDLVQVLGDLQIDKSFTLRLFGAGGSISPDELIPIFLYDGALYIGGNPYDAITNPLQYLIDIGNLEDPNNLYIWDICDTNLQILNIPDQGIYLTGLTAELIPEPTTLTLLGLGALALLRRRRRAA